MKLKNSENYSWSQTEFSVTHCNLTLGWRSWPSLSNPRGTVSCFQLEQPTMTYSNTAYSGLLSGIKCCYQEVSHAFFFFFFCFCLSIRLQLCSSIKFIRTIQIKRRVWKQHPDQQGSSLFHLGVHTENKLKLWGT